MWRAIWNGPFYIGKLTSPTSVGDAILKVLETLWRGVIVFGLGCVAFVAVFLASSWFDSRRDADALRSVLADARLDPACPRGEFAVTIRNNSKYTLHYVDYRVVMTLRGRDVTPDHLRDLWSCEDIPSGQQLTTCHSTAWDKNGTPTTYRTEEGTVWGVRVTRVDAK